MKSRTFSTIIVPIFTVCTLAAVSLAIIAYGRGYRPGFGDDQLIRPTGLVSATSDPIGAQVYVDNELRTATNNSFSIDPGWYTIRISQEGFQSWQKTLRVQGEVVTRADAFLFAVSPSLSPVTNVGIANPTLSPDGTLISYVIPPREDGNATLAEDSAGLWIYELVDRTLGFNRFPGQLDEYDGTFDFENAQYQWSPDSTQLMATAENGAVRLYEVNQEGQFQNISFTYEDVLEAWETERQENIAQQLSAFKQPFIDMATSSATIISFSPDETKVLYEATAAATIPLIINPPLIGSNPTEEARTVEPGSLYVYDSREDKNFFLVNTSEIPGWPGDDEPAPTSTPRATTTPVPDEATPLLSPSVPIHWFPTSRHLVLTLQTKIDIMEYDRTNWITVYSGPFVDGFMAPWPNGSRILILTNLNPGATRLPNLYTVNLR